ncbi:MAG: methyltransferase domain-containing protein [Dehalococcoidia bacterium]
MVQQAQRIDEAKLNQLLGQVVTDFGATISNALVVIGDRLGLYQAMADGEPVTAESLAERTGAAEKYLRPWLVNQASVGYLDYDPTTGRYRLSPEATLLFADSASPANVIGGFQLMASVVKTEARLYEIYRTGAGLPWGEYDPGLFEGTEKFFRPGYRANLVQSWLPALDGVVDKLERGATIADVGCGYGASTIILAEAFPTSRYFGFDNHAASIQVARDRAIEAGVTDRVIFETASAADYPGEQFDLIAFFDCFHDLGDPNRAAQWARQALATDGTVMLVEPMAGQKVEDNFNVVGRIFSAASASICTPNAVATGGQGLGTISTDDEIRAVLNAAGFSRVRRATETPFNRVFEARI